MLRVNGTGSDLANFLDFTRCHWITCDGLQDIVFCIQVHC